MKTTPPSSDARARQRRADDPNDLFVSEEELLARGAIEGLDQQAAPEDNPLDLFLPEQPERVRGTWPRRTARRLGLLAVACGAAAAVAIWTAPSVFQRSSIGGPVAVPAAGAATEQAPKEPAPPRRSARQATARPLANEQSPQEPAPSGDFVDGASPRLPFRPLIETSATGSADAEASAMAGTTLVGAPAMEAAGDVVLTNALETAPAAPVPAVAPDAPAGTGADVVEAESSAVRDVLTRYKTAYDDLDASEAARLWPAVDREALARAFASLASQTLALDTCDVRVGDATANARCRGSIRVVRKVGSSDPIVVPQAWTFNLRRSDEGWEIEDVAVDATP